MDKNGYRSNVAIVLSDGKGRVLLAKRIGQASWQFPQGGIDDGETPEKALYRELEEEVGLLPESVRLLGSTQDWFKYRLPEHMTRKNSNPGFLGQKQKWFLLELIDNDNKVIIDGGTSPEFQDWQWVSYWYPITAIVDFKRSVYRSALSQLAQYLP